MNCSLDTLSLLLYFLNCSRIICFKYFIKYAIVNKVYEYKYTNEDI